MATDGESMWEVLDAPNSVDEIKEALAPFPRLELRFLNKTFDNIYLVEEDGKNKVVTWDGDLYPIIEDPNSFVYGSSDITGLIEDYFKEQFAQDFKEAPSPLYHATPKKSAKLIMKQGLKASNKSRGLTNRGVGAAIFTADSLDAVSDSYGDAIIKIDLPAMKADGLDFDVEQEPGYFERQAYETLASAMDIDDFYYESSDSSSEDPSTVILYVPTVPPKYLTLVNNRGETLPSSSLDDRVSGAYTGVMAPKKTSKSRRVRASTPVSLAEAKDVMQQAAAKAGEEGIPVALGGGFAMQAYGSTRLTSDVDLMASKLPSFAEDGEPITVGGKSVVIDGVEVDFVVRNDEYADLYQEAVERAKPAAGHNLPVITPEYLVAMKMVAGRPKDDLDLYFLLSSVKMDSKKLTDIVSRFLGRYAVSDLKQQAETAKWMKKAGKL